MVLQASMRGRAAAPTRSASTATLHDLTGTARPHAPPRLAPNRHRTTSRPTALRRDRLGADILHAQLGQHRHWRVPNVPRVRPARRARLAIHYRTPTILKNVHELTSFNPHSTPIQPS